MFLRPPGCEMNQFCRTAKPKLPLYVLPMCFNGFETQSEFCGYLTCAHSSSQQLHDVELSVRKCFYLAAGVLSGSSNESVQQQRSHPPAQIDFTCQYRPD